MAKSPKPAQPVAPAAALDGERRAYVVSADAPSRVAGQRVSPGATLHLTEAEARAELLALHIAPAAEAVSKDV